jgi:hypothetical protein
LASEVEGDGDIINSKSHSHSHTPPLHALRLNKVSVQISELPMTSTVLALWESGVNREPAGCCFIVHGLKIQEQVDLKSEARGRHGTVFSACSLSPDFCSCSFCDLQQGSAIRCFRFIFSRFDTFLVLDNLIRTSSELLAPPASSPTVRRIDY